MSKRTYPQYPTAPQQLGMNYPPPSSVPGQLPPGQTLNYPYHQQSTGMGQPPGMGGLTTQGQTGQYPPTGSQAVSRITAGVQQMQVQTAGIMHVLLKL